MSWHLYMSMLQSPGFCFDFQWTKMTKGTISKHVCDRPSTFFSLSSCLFQPNLRVLHLLLMQWHSFNLQHYLWYCRQTGTRLLSWDCLFTWRSCMSHSCYLCGYIWIEILRFLSLLFLSICKSLLFEFWGFFCWAFFGGEGERVGFFKLFLFTESECRSCHITSVNIEIKEFSHIGKAKMCFFLLVYRA